jgi:class 3 adenylate cyclase
VGARGVTLFAMADLPSGAITFLFTDIEGSTQLLKQLRERYSHVLTEHQRLLRGPSPHMAAMRSTPRVTLSSSRSRAHETRC